MLLPRNFVQLRMIAALPQPVPGWSLGELPLCLGSASLSDGFRFHCARHGSPNNGTAPDMGPAIRTLLSYYRSPKSGRRARSLPRGALPLSSWHKGPSIYTPRVPSFVLLREIQKEPEPGEPRLFDRKWLQVAELPQVEESMKHQCRVNASGVSA